MSRVAALVVAAGRGSRLGASTPKQYLHLSGQPLLRHCLACFVAHPKVDLIRVVISPEHNDSYAIAAQGLDILPPVPGGATRQDSVRRGLESLVEMEIDCVLIHDGARPFVAAALIDRILESLTSTAASIPGLPVSDTLKRVSQGWIIETEARSGLWRAQTPQGFDYAAIRDAHRHAAVQDRQVTDDAQVAEEAGLTVQMVEGAVENVKITTQSDLERAEGTLAGATEIRIGQGFDVHRFDESPGPVRLCGIEVPHDHALAGHSDADVGLHVVVDALLGALGAGDIGQHFPPSDTRWQAADSALFVRHARDLIAQRGGWIVNIDVTLICEKPKIGPHTAEMASRIAGLLGIMADRVGVKATTTEGLGFTGRREGIAAQAAASVRLPSGPA